MKKEIRRSCVALVLCAAGLLASCQRSGAPGDAPRFPAPDRPVAPIISSAYSNEQARDEAREADRVMDRLGIGPGKRIADIGAGDGYYTVRIARRLGPSATIYAEDVNAEYLQRLETRLKREGIRGVRTVLGLPGDPKLPPASVDVAILSHMYHEIENPYEFLYRLWPALAPTARVGIVDADRPTQNHGTPPALLHCEMSAVGYRQVDFLQLAPTEVYLAIFAPPEELPRVESIAPCKQWHGSNIRPWQDAEKPAFDKVTQKSPDARRRAHLSMDTRRRVRFIPLVVSLSNHAARRERTNAAGGPFSAAD